MSEENNVTNSNYTIETIVSGDGRNRSESFLDTLYRGEIKTQYRAINTASGDKGELFDTVLEVMESIF